MLVWCFGCPGLSMCASIPCLIFKEEVPVSGFGVQV